MQKTLFKDGIDLLEHPVLPIASMVQFFIMTGDFASVTEIIDQLPESIETGTSVYNNPAALLLPYIDQLEFLLAVKNGAELPFKVVDESGNEADSFIAAAAIMDQDILEKELEQINSILCAPCGCTLCCVGPDLSMEQSFFEIPLQAEEVALFAVEKIDIPASRAVSAMVEPPLQLNDKPFYQREKAVVTHWQNGWSLILPESSRCPNLEGNGRCAVYGKRPSVCRKPQIFPYILEPVVEAGDEVVKRIQRKLLAIVDCPYVQLLKDEIAQYAAACELDLILKQNKK